MSEVTVIKAGNGKVKRERDKFGTAVKIDRIRVAAYARVSTDGDEQLGSFQSQVKFYTDKIQSNKDWVFAGVYSDEAITGTSSKKRPGFQKMIQDCMDGKIDMVLTKSISRFARNTVDTLRYVRMLKDKQVAVVFEKENIDTLSMNGELLLSILSSIAQQDVETISSNVKMGLKMKMSRGELVGYNGCLGYDYDPETKTISINQREAEIVRMIFDMYLQGYGSYTISRRLEEMKIKNRKGEVSWTDSGVLGIIKNEKYKGDLLMGKSITVDPITKRRIDNFGEEDQYYMENHHEAIISKEDWEKAQEIRLDRAHNKELSADGKREVAMRKYAFSSMCECGFCGTKLTRRTFHSNSVYQKPVWYCRTAANKGKKLCPHSKSIDESILEGAFLDSYKLLAENFDDVIESVLSTVESSINDNHDAKRLAQIKKDISSLESRRSKLLDMLMDGKISQEAYDEKYKDFSNKIDKYVDEQRILLDNVKEQKNIGKRMAEMKNAISIENVLDEFDRLVFESIVDKVIVGAVDENGNVDPFKLTYVFKTNDVRMYNEMKSRYRKFKEKI